MAELQLKAIIQPLCQSREAVEEEAIWVGWWKKPGLSSGIKDNAYGGFGSAGIDYGGIDYGGFDYGGFDYGG